MKIIFYWDVWVALNTLLRCISFDVVDQMCHQKNDWKKRFFLSLVSSGISLWNYAWLCLLVKNSILFLLAEILLLCGTTYCLWGKSHASVWMLSTARMLLFYLLVGGVILLLYVRRIHFSFLHCIIIMLFIWLAARILLHFLINDFAETNSYRIVEMSIKKNSFRFNAFYDSGNCLTEPFLGRPVVLVSEKVFESFEHLLNRKIYVPYYSLGNEDGYVWAYGIDELFLRGEKEKRFTNIYIAKANHLFKHDVGYDVILHRTMI